MLQEQKKRQSLCSYSAGLRVVQAQLWYPVQGKQAAVAKHPSLAQATVLGYLPGPALPLLHSWSSVLHAHSLFSSPHLRG
jgi:hypothetical protein